MSKKVIIFFSSISYIICYKANDKYYNDYGLSQEINFKKNDKTKEYDYLEANILYEKIDKLNNLLYSRDVEYKKLEQSSYNHNHIQRYIDSISISEKEYDFNLVQKIIKEHQDFIDIVIFGDKENYYKTQNDKIKNDNNITELEKDIMIMNLFINYLKRNK